MRLRTVRWAATLGALLPWLTWVLPIYSFDSEKFDDQSVSLAAGAAGQSGAVVLFAPILVMAVLAVVAWVRRPGIAWAVFAALVVVIPPFMLIPLSEGAIIWDGVDEHGRPTGGYSVLGPDWGLAVMVVSLALWLAAFVLVVSGLQREASSPPDAEVADGSDTMAG